MATEQELAGRLIGISECQLRDTLDGLGGSAYIVSSHDLALAWFNGAFARFWAENGGEIGQCGALLGRGILEAMSPPLTAFYANLYASALRTGVPDRHRYACPSRHSTRWFSQLVIPRRDALVIVNALLFEQSRPQLRCLVDGHAAVSVCCHCRRAYDPSRQQWFATADAYSSGNTIDTLCDDCGELFAREQMQRSRTLARRTRSWHERVKAAR